MDGGAKLVDVGAVRADELVEFIARDAELLGPVCNVGSHFRVDQLGIVRTLGGVVLVQGVGLEAALRPVDLACADQLVAWRRTAAAGQ